MALLPFTRPTIDEATIAAVADTLRSGWIASGARVKQFEQALSDYIGGRPVRVVTSATEALEIALRVCGIGPGDEVITPAMSFAATANVICRVGARPVFVDVDLASRNIDVAATARAITPRTKAIMPVHFAGLAIDMDGLYTLARQHRLRVIEDAACAIGTLHQGRRIGSFGDIVCFSFHPNKNMTSIEGGAIVLPDASAVDAVDQHRFHGIRKDAAGQVADVLFPGAKANLSDVAAAVGLAQLARLEEFNARRRELVALYYSRLSTTPAFSLPARGDGGHSWHIFAPLLPLSELSIDRAGYIAAMRAQDIGVGIHYPALHLFSCYRKQGWNPGDFPNAERIGASIVTLPLFPLMSAQDVDRVISASRQIFAENRR